MATKPETNFRKKARADLTALKQSGKPLFFEAIQQKAIKGSLDYHLCCNGHFVALELKAEDGIISPIQDEKLTMVSNAGGLSLVGYPSNWAQVLKTIVFFLEEDNDCNGTHEISEEVRHHSKGLI
jgi:hypothetical protein